MLRIKVKEECQYISFTKTCCVSGHAQRDEGVLPVGHLFEANAINRDVPQKGVSTIWMPTDTLHPDRWLVPSKAIEVLDFEGNESEKL